MKIVINTCYGGFSLSDKAVEELGIQSPYFNIERDNKDLIALIEKKGPRYVSGPLSTLKIVEIPDGIEWEIEEYDGFERVAERHRVWA